ncbi:MAG: ribosome silencing factor [Pseudomonadota bacterium]
MNTDSICALVCDSLDNLKGIDTIVLDVREKTSVTDTMVICTGTSARHVKSLANEVLEKAKAANIDILGAEGQSQGDWVLIDLGDVVAHVMTAQTRDFYALEKLWSIDGESDAEGVDSAVEHISKLRQQK